MAVTTFAMAVPAIAVSAFDHGGARSSSIVAAWARALRWLAGVEVVVEGLENLPAEASQVFVSTHQSMLDVPALFAAVPARTRFVAKKDLFRIPLFGRAIRMLGFVPIDREDRRGAVAALGQAAELARSQRPILVFPEGTRSRDGRLLPFKKGAFALAHQLRLPIVPIACLGGARCMPPGTMRLVPGRMTLRIGRVIDPSRDDYSSRNSLMEATRAEIERLVGSESKEGHADSPE
jgi:1-acyl-sn-glycerol-3-phosphate acyltransferase